MPKSDSVSVNWIVIFVMFIWIFTKIQQFNAVVTREAAPAIDTTELQRSLCN